MASQSDTSSTNSPPLIISTTTSTPTSTLISFTSAYLPIKLSHTNYSSWRSLVDSLFHGHYLIPFLDGSKPYPPPTITTDGVSLPNLDFAFWIRPEKFLLYALITSLEPDVLNLLGHPSSAKEAWEHLRTLFANQSRSRLMYLKEKLSIAHHGSQPVSVFLQTIKNLAAEIVIISQPIDDLDIVIYALNGLGLEFKEISGRLCARDTPITFLELHEILVDFETYSTKTDPPLFNLPSLPMSLPATKTYHSKNVTHPPKLSFQHPPTLPPPPLSIASCATNLVILPLGATNFFPTLSLKNPLKPTTPPFNPPSTLKPSY